MLYLRHLAAAALVLASACSDIAPGETCVASDPSLGCEPITEGASCREHVCDSDEKCAVGVRAGFCYDPAHGGCIAENGTSPTDPCLVCDPASTSNALVAKRCGVGEVCQQGICTIADTDVLDAANGSDVPDAADVEDSGPEAETTEFDAETTEFDAELPEFDAELPEFDAETTDSGSDTEDADAGPLPDVDSDTGIDDALVDGDIGGDTDIGGDVGPDAAPGLVLFPQGLTTLAPPGAAGPYKLIDHRFVYSLQCAAGICVTGGISP